MTTRRRYASSLWLSYTHCASSTSCIVTRFWSSPRMPDRTRRSSCMCAPTPSRRPRCTHRVRMYVPASHDTQNTTRLRSSSYSMSLDSYIVRMRSWRFTAEMSGGRWKRAPVSVSMARATLALPPSGAACRRQMVRYSLPAPCCAFTSLVARSTHTMRPPVTFGSSVPLWPVFSTLRMRRIQATTSCEDGFAGLSRFITPDLM
mmetsp:Transcript_4589/g.16031  ORF Transcript_4589/g.16031 Transcript_4589/m.16031 type:complete len:203 (-) Transcript_4589:257-865(-)